MASAPLTVAQNKLLIRARRAHDAITTAKADRVAAVRACRAAGIEWVPIADELGMSVLGASRILTREGSRSAS